MDSAENEALRHAIALQGQHLGHHKVTLKRLSEQLQEVSSAIATLNEHLASAPATPPQAPSPQPASTDQPVPPVSVPEPNIPPPAKYSGDPNTCRQFLTQCQLAFSAQPIRYASEAAKVAYLVNLYMQI